MRARYYWAATIAGFAIYTAIAILGSTSTLVYWRQAHYPFDAEAFLANRFLEQWTCALFVPALFWLTERFPITPSALRWRNIGVLAGAVAVFSLVKYSVMLPLYRLWTGHWEMSYWLAVLDNAVPVAFDFFAIIGVAHALRYHRDVGERERVAAELHTQLVQARLDALRGQLHPHFIFNSLNAPGPLHADAADRMLTQLGELLRMSVDRGESEIPLADELEMADRYLGVMRHRFSDRLTVECTIDANAKQAMVPTFFIQPLIENALEHGIARRRGPGRVEIRARRDDGKLEVIVADDGPGLSSPPPPGVGLSNTKARLQQLYGDDSAFRLETMRGGGARAVVRIPFRECPAS